VIDEPPSAPAENVRVTVLTVGEPETAKEVGAPVGTVVMATTQALPSQRCSDDVSVRKMNCPVNGDGITAERFAVVVTVIPERPEASLA
jgi:CRISPR/Cas system-associated protein Csx1